jgi:hypothetical protein
MCKRAAEWLWLVPWCILGSLWCFSSAARVGPTFDEPFYLEEGLKTWRTGKPGGLLQKGTMPLPVLVTTAPVRVWELLRGKPVDLANEFHDALAVARPATLVFWWLLIVYGSLLAHRVGGPWAAWISVPLLACEPNLLANAALATTDIALSACLLVFIYHYQAGRDGPWAWRVGLPAVLYGVAVLAKASALVFGVLVMVTLEVLRATEKSAPGNGWRQRLVDIWLAVWSRSFRHDTVQIISLGLAIAIVVCGSDWQPERSFFAWSHALPEGRFASLMAWLSEHLRLFPNGGQAIVRQIKHNIQGHGAYLLGHTSERALWYFFPIALTIKLALPLLLLPICLALLSPRSLCNQLTVLAVVFLIFSLNCHVQIGIRLVFPLVVFFILAVSIALAHAWKQSQGNRRRVLVGLICCAQAWMMVAAVSAWPNGLRYVNEAWGGSDKGYLCVGGSDYDWGQGFPELDRWANGQSLCLFYFGTDPLAASPRYECLNALIAVREDICEAMLVERLRGRDLAVSIGFLYGPPLGTPAFQQLLANLRVRQPIARTDCFFIYRLSQSRENDPASAQHQFRSARR